MQPKAAHRPVAVRLSTKAISHIAQHVVDGFTSPEGRQEVCGVLIGWMSDDAERRLTIEDAQAVVSECAPNTSNVVLESAAPEFERLVHQHSSSSGSGMPVVGYYRSHMRTDLNVDGSDVALLRGCFPDPVSLCMLIKPAANKTLVGALFYYADGAVHRHPATINLPNPALRVVDDSLLVRNTPEFAHDASLQTSVLGLTEQSRPAPPAPYEPPITPAPITKSSRSVWPAVALAIVGAAAGTYALIEFLRPNVAPSELRGAPGASGTASDEVPSQLGLRVTRDGADLRVSWKRNSPNVAGARAAVLSILDGEQRQDVLLDTAQLQSGSVLYTPVSDHVQFRLELLSASSGQNTQETVLAISGRRSPTAPQRTTPPQVQPQRAPVQGSVSPSAPPAPQTAATVPPPKTDPSPPPVTAAKTPPRQFAPPASKEPVRVVMVDPPPGQIPPANAGAPPRFQATPDTPPPAVAPPPAVKPEPAAEPAQQVAEPSTPPPTPPVVRGAQQRVQQLTPPRPTVQVAPNVPRDIRSMIFNEVVVDVRVKVDATGKVLSVEPMRLAGPMRPFLERAAADAARLWRFEPARLGDQKVEGEALVQFRFRSSNTQQEE